jgi:hypothetical protein
MTPMPTLRQPPRDPIRRTDNIWHVKRASGGSGVTLSKNQVPEHVNVHFSGVSCEANLLECWRQSLFRVVAFDVGEESGPAMVESGVLVESLLHARRGRCGCLFGS